MLRGVCPLCGRNLSAAGQDSQTREWNVPKLFRCSFCHTESARRWDERREKERVKTKSSLGSLREMFYLHIIFSARLERRTGVCEEEAGKSKGLWCCCWGALVASISLFFFFPFVLFVVPLSLFASDPNLSEHGMAYFPRLTTSGRRRRSQYMSWEKSECSLSERRERERGE